MNADALSCNPLAILAVSAAVASDSASGNPNSGTSQESELSRKQRQDPDFSGLFRYIEDGILPEDRLQAKRMVLERQQFAIVDNVLYYENPDFPGVWRLLCHSVCVKPY